MDKASYEKRREDDQRRFVRFTVPEDRTIYVDRNAINSFGTDVEGNPFIHFYGIAVVVKEKVSEIMTALGMRE